MVNVRYFIVNFANYRITRSNKKRPNKIIIGYKHTTCQYLVIHLRLAEVKNFCFTFVLLLKQDLRLRILGILGFLVHLGFLKVFGFIWTPILSPTLCSRMSENGTHVFNVKLLRISENLSNSVLRFPSIKQLAIPRELIRNSKNIRL